MDRDEYIAWYKEHYDMPPTVRILEKYFPVKKDEELKVPEEFWRENPLDG